MKNKVIQELCNDEVFFYAINSPDITSFEDSADLLNTHLFRYNQNPETLDKTITYVTVQTHVEQLSYSDNKWLKASLEFWIYSHEKCMVVNNIPGIKDDRIDYISRILDTKFNGSYDFGYGGLVCTYNKEGAFAKDYLYRRMIFETTDINDSLCQEGVKWK